MSDTFAILIISHGRPDAVVTLGALKRAGYTGKTYIVIDNVDKTAEAYYDNFGKEMVYMFDKEQIARTTDNGDNFENYRSTTHARNACFQIAEKLGLDYFMVLDDDYVKFQHRFNQHHRYEYSAMRSMDQIALSMIEFLKADERIKTLCMAQGGDFIGGDHSGMAQKVYLKRKAMNSWLCATKRPIKFISRLNEDVNTYLVNGMRGDLFFTLNQISLVQKQTQTNAGGMSEAYIDSGTFIKSFYSVMYCPSFVKVSIMGPVNKRIHHLTHWDMAVPKILRETYRKTPK
jgi:hypothetical protein